MTASCAPPTMATPGRESVPHKESKDPSNCFKKLSLSPHRGEILDNSRMTINNDDALKAIDSSTLNAPIEKHAEFPFLAIIDKRSAPLKTPRIPADKPIWNLSQLGMALHL
jgi:hypothetical protein